MCKSNLLLLFFFITFSFLTNADGPIHITSDTQKQYQLDYFTHLLIGKESVDPQYNHIIEKYIGEFKNRFISPISSFETNNIKTSGETLFYPFAGADIAYPLMFFPNIKQYVLVGLEFPGLTEIIQGKFEISKFQPQMEGFLKSGFFKTMKMSAQMHYKQGVIPMLFAQIGILNGQIKNISSISEPFKGIVIEFIHNNIDKKLYYFRANLDDTINKDNFFEFIKSNKLSDNCMLKASSYKLHQWGFDHLRQFMLNNCQLILQDDTGMPIKYLRQQNRDIEIFGNYIKPYGEEFQHYYQKELAKLYENKENKINLKFCYGYGCGMVENNILLAKTKSYTIKNYNEVNTEEKKTDLLNEKNINN